MYFSKLFEDGPNGQVLSAMMDARAFADAFLS